MSPPQIQPKTFFGLRTDIKGNAHFITDSEIIYPAGGVLVLYDYVEKKQKFINLSDNPKTIRSISISPNQQYIALAENGNDKDRKPSIGIYDLKTLKLKKNLIIPFEDISSCEFVTIQFTCDSKYLAAITGEPDWMLYYYNWESGKIESHAKAQNPNGMGRITQVNCNPTDPTLVVVTGPGTFRLMNVLESIWRQWGWNKAENFIITSSMWLTPDRVLFGTNKGILMTVENGELKENWSFNGIDVTEIAMKKMEERTESDATAAHERFLGLSLLGNEAHEIRCLTSFKRGFVYSSGSGLVHMFEQESKNRTWVKRNVYKVIDEPFRIGENEFEDLNIIQQISVNPNQNTLLVTTLKSQLYYAKLFEQHILQEPQIAFKELGQRLHHKSINGLAMCSWKPIFMTSGKEDWSIRIWNYETEELELVKFYHGDITCISLHPTGLFALIGFSDKLRYMVILIDDLYQMREFDVRNCRVCHYSNNGHMFAAVNDMTIQVYSTISFLNLFNLKGHTSTIQSISWAGSDDKLFSCGSDGGVYEWCMISGNRINDIVLKNNDFSDCAATSDGKSVYVVGIDTEVKEVNNNEIIRHLKIIGVKLDNIVLARSDYMLFVSGGRGNVVSIQFPLLDKAIFAEFCMHNANVTAMALSYDDLTLITVADDATICIWRLVNSDGKAVVMDKHFLYSEDILINKNDLREKNVHVKMLSKRINEMEVEHEYELRKINYENADKLKETHANYCNTIDELKEKIEYLEGCHSYEINVMKNDIEKTQFEYERKLEVIEADFNAKKIYEYEKYTSLEDRMYEMNKNYEEQLAELAKKKDREIQVLKDEYEALLGEKKTQIVELEEKEKLESKQHEYIKCMIEEDADREILEIKTQYELQLKGEKDLNVRCKGELEVLKKKLEDAQCVMDENKFQISQLLNEHKQYQTFIKGLENNIAELKREIKGRDGTIQEETKSISDLKINIQELEKYKFVLNYRIEELEKEIEPKNDVINNLTKQIQEMALKENDMKLSIYTLGLEVEAQKGKIKGFQDAVREESEKNYDLKHRLKKIQDEILELSSYIQDPAKLKVAVKNLLRFKCVADNTFHDKESAQNIIQELSLKISFLYRQAAEAHNKLKKIEVKHKVTVGKMMEENLRLLKKIEELNKLPKK